MLAVRQGGVLYTTLPVETRWKQVVVPASLQQKFSFRSDNPAFWLVIPNRGGWEILAASALATTGRLVEQETDRVLAELSIPAGAVVRKKVPR